tara:strand:+ start:856 stop:3282 length:2427 start_codon:yes stop_codon:yes gene_type:complete
MATKIRPFNLHADTETRIQTLAGNLIDSAYVNARVSTVDSAAVQVIVDSDYVKTTLKVGSTNTIFRYVATANQTSFTGSDANSATLAYNPGAVQVFLNGSLLTPTVDFTTDSGDTITLVSGAALGSELVINTYKDGIITPTNALPIIGGELTGNLTMGDNRKIKLGNDSDAEIFHNASNTIINDKGTGDILLQVAGTTHFQTNATGVQVPDNKKLQLGTSNDLEIFHESTGNHSVIRESGTGSLFIDATNIHLRSSQSDGFEALATFAANGSVDLYHNNVKKFETTADGVTVTGNVSVSGDIIKTTAGTSNFAAGVNAGNSIASGGNYNVVLGDEAGTAITTGDGNTAVGFEALKTEDAHGFNTAVGYQTLKSLNAGAEGYNVAVGHQAGTAITTGIANVIVGANAGDAMTTGLINVLVGTNAGSGLTEGLENVAMGHNSLLVDTKGQRSTALGYGTLAAQNFTSLTEVYNTAVGFNAGASITTGTVNTLIGGFCGDTMTTGGSNAGVGYQALDGCTDGAGNAALGYRAGYSITSGARNVALGEQALRGVTTGNDNIGLGTQSFFATCTGSANIGMGYRSLFSLTSGSSNVALGYQAGMDIDTESNSTYVGYRAGLNHTQGDNVAIGYQVNTNNCGNIITIGYDCATVGNLHITMGNGSGANRIYNSFTANANWTRVSDQRWKKDVETNTDCGLSFVNDLRTVTFKKKAPNEVDKSMASYDSDDDGINENGLRTVPTHKMYGFLAQEVKQAMDKHNITDFGGWDEAEDSDKTQGISESMFVIPLVKAVQELSTQVTTLTDRITELENK